MKKQILLFLIVGLSSCYPNYPTTSFWIHNNSEKEVNFNASIYKANTPPPHIMSQLFTINPGDSVLFRRTGFPKKGNPVNVFKEMNFIPINKRMHDPNDSLNWIKSVGNKGKPKYDLYIFSQEEEYDNGKSSKNCYNLSEYSKGSEGYKIFKNSHGLKKGSSKYIDVEGYSILSKDHDDAYFNERYIKHIKKDYGIDKNNPGAINNSLNFKHLLFTKDYKISDTIYERVLLYLIPKEDDRVKVIAFSTSMSRDTTIENLFLKNIINNSVPETVFTKSKIDSINFAGRCLYLGSSCKWISPHNIKHPYFGQISWSVFRTKDKAEEYSNMNYLIASNKIEGKIIEKDSVDVVFEKIYSRALKVKYQLESNTFTTYYVTEKIRGKYVACVMSHYNDDVITNGLTPLIEEIMQIKE